MVKAKGWHIIISLLYLTNTFIFLLCTGLLVHIGFCKLCKQVVRLSLLIQYLLQQKCSIFISQRTGKVSPCAVWGNLIILYFLCDHNQPVVTYHCSFVGTFDDLIGFFNQPFHYRAFLCLCFLPYDFKYLLQCGCMLCCLGSVQIESRFELLWCCILGDFNQGFGQVLFCPVNIFQAVNKQFF